jgi:hypothetical protein
MLPFDNSTIRTIYDFTHTKFFFCAEVIFWNNTSAHPYDQSLMQTFFFIRINEHFGL